MNEEPRMTPTSLADLTPDPRNARRHNPRNVSTIVSALHEVGAARSIVIDENGVVLAGNATIEAAAEAGIERVQVVDADGETIIAVRRTGLSAAQKQRLALFDNRSAELADWDADVLAQLVAENATSLDGLFGKDELADLLADVGKGVAGEDLGAEMDRAEELRAKWQTAPGQLWEIPSAAVPGKAHRLLCGDAKEAEDVARLMGGSKATVLWTDPPYGVEYVGKTKAAHIIQNDSAAGLAELLARAFAALGPAMDESAAFYVAHPAGGQHRTFITAIQDAGWRFHQTLIWVKDTMVLGHTDYHYRHEPIYYGYFPGRGRPVRGDHDGSRWRGNHSQTSIFEIERPKRSEDHPTMKPTALVRACFENNTRPGEIVLDVFTGSGSTIVASEQAGRLGYGLEIDPAYIAVVLERLAGMGLAPRLAESVHA